MIAVGSVITGVDAVIVNITSSFGPDTAFVYKFNIGFRGNITGEELRRKPLTMENAQAIEERCPSVQHISPFLFPPTMFTRGQALGRVRYRGKEVLNPNFAGTEYGYSEGGQPDDVRAFLHRRGELPAAAGGGDRRGHLQSAVAG